MITTNDSEEDFNATNVESRRRHRGLPTSLLLELPIQHPRHAAPDSTPPKGFLPSPGAVSVSGMSLYSHCLTRTFVSTDHLRL